MGFISYKISLQTCHLKTSGYDQSQSRVFFCVVDYSRLLSSVGLPQAGKDVTIILHLQELEKVIKGLDQEEKINKLRTKIYKIQAELDRLTEELKTLEES